MSDKPDSRGRGPWTAKGVQAAQQAAIDEGATVNAQQAQAIAELQALVQELAAKLDEAGVPDDSGDPQPVDPNQPQPTDDNDPAQG